MGWVGFGWYTGVWWGAVSVHQVRKHKDKVVPCRPGFHSDVYSAGMTLHALFAPPPPRDKHNKSSSIAPDSEVRTTLTTCEMSTLSLSCAHLPGLTFPPTQTSAHTPSYPGGPLAAQYCVFAMCVFCFCALVSLLCVCATVVGAATHTPGLAADFAPHVL